MTDVPKFGFLCVGKNPLDLSVSVHTSHKLASLLRLAGFMPGGCYTEIIDINNVNLSFERAAKTLKHLCLSNELVITVGNTGFSEYDIIPDITDVICKRKASYFTNILCGSSALPCKKDSLITEPSHSATSRLYPDRENASYEQCLQNSSAKSSATFSSRVSSALSRLSEKITKPSNKINLDSPLYSCPAVNTSKNCDEKNTHYSGHPPFDKEKSQTLRLHPSRACAGISNKSLILNFPSDPVSAYDTAQAVMSALWVCVYNISGKSASLAFNYEKMLKSLPEFQEIINKKDIVNT